MIVQVNTDHNTPGSASLNDFISTSVKSELDIFAENITRVEVHLADENGSKSSENDKRCTMEARVSHRQPIAVTCHANGYEEAISGALDKMRASLDTVFGKMTNH